MINRRWTLGIAASVLVVVAAIVGVILVQSDVLGEMWTYLFLVVGILGAVSAMLQTIVRSKAGDDLDDSVG